MTVKTSIETESEVFKNIKIEIPCAIFNAQMAQKLGSVAGRCAAERFSQRQSA
ncbi:MAG: hypothetical protein LBE20_00215 [Deltaproteobacteria bacterium]|jgi:hypothetical protein|nr:hypothetical protein [Deltaproteobacteria bacterium]